MLRHVEDYNANQLVNNVSKISLSDILMDP